MALTSAHRNRANDKRTVTAGPARQHLNVGDGERWASIVGGGLLALYGVSRLSKGGIWPALIGGGLVYRGTTGHCGAYAALGVNTAARRGVATSVEAGKGVRVEKTVHINRSAAELYQYWRNLENLPRFMRHLKSVTTKGNRSHWTVRGPMGVALQWDAEIINDRPNELIAWRSLEGSDVNSAGSVHFKSAPGGRGTWVNVVLKYDPPTGKFGAACAQMLGQQPEKQIAEDLKRFKQLLEVGETTSYSGGEHRFSWPSESDR